MVSAVKRAATSRNEYEHSERFSMRRSPSVRRIGGPSGTARGKTESRASENDETVASDNHPRQVPTVATPVGNGQMSTVIRSGTRLLCNWAYYTHVVRECQRT